MDTVVRAFTFRATARPMTVIDEEGYCALAWPELGLTTCGRDKASAADRLPEALRGLADTYAEEPDQGQALREYLDSHGAEYTLVPADEVQGRDGVFPLEEAGVQPEVREVLCGFSLAASG